MVRPAGVLLLLVLGTSGALGDSPVQKVIELLEENKGKIQDDLAAEEKEMEEYAGYCDDQLTEKGFAIKTSTSTITALTAEIEQDTSEVASLQEEVAEVGKLIASKEGQLADAAAVRKSEKDSFMKTEAELEESIGELEGAVKVMKQDASFVQQSKSVSHSQNEDVKKTMKVIAKILSASWVNQKTFKALKGFVQVSLGETDDLKLAPPEAAAFETKSGGIVAQLEDMKEKAEEQLSDARTGEMRDKHAYDMMAQSLTDGVKVAKEKLAKTKSAIESATEELGKAHGDLADATRSKDADEKFVASLTADCSDAKEAWADRQQKAQEEMAVIEKAKGILSERVKVAGLVQVQKGDGDEESPRQHKAREHVMDKLRALSKKFHSYALMEAVTAASSDPFGKIKGLIEGMISKLTAEANAQATQKSFCDEEKAKSLAAKQEKSMTLDTLSSRLEKAKTAKAELEMEVKSLEGEVAALDKGEAEATTIRNQEHATYLKSSADFKGAATAVGEAVTVLKEYYEGAASLAQVGAVHAAGAPTFGGSKSDSASVILSILENSAENFETMYMKVEQEEREAVSAFEKLQLENKVSKAASGAEIKGASSEIKSLEVAILNGEEDASFTSKELDSVLAYLDKLKPQCETKAMAYEEKKARREAEIEGLKEALGTLEGEALVQLRLRGGH